MSLCMFSFAFAMLAVAVSPIAALGGAEECDEDCEELPVARMLLQHHPVRSQHVEAFAWFASAFGSCLTGCTSGPLQTRRVECRSVYDNLPAPNDACAGPKPTAVAATCNCELQLCQVASASQDCPPQNGTNVTDGKVDTRGYTTVGCFVAPGAALKDTAYDRTCEKWNSTRPCLSGLPFYSQKEAGMDEAKCYKFCMQKGMDIFGIQGAAVCRCGASLLNEVVWHHIPPHPGLAFNPIALMQSTEGACPLKVYRYAGHYESGGTPSIYWDIKEQDLAYTDSVVSGEDISEAREEDGSMLSMMQGGAAISQEQKKAKPLGSQRRCWPQNCGPGPAKPWKKQSGPVPEPKRSGGNDIWSEYVFIDYMFELNNGDSGTTTRKDTFRSAVNEWMARTCIVFKEIDAQSTANTVYVKVGNYYAKSCAAYRETSWPGVCSGSPCPYSYVNLGWCMDMRERGSMIHELGHTLGMNHEQSRPDATSNFQGHGPYLKMHWENIPSEWTHNFAPDKDSYVGSADDGVGDPFSGYSDYDFESIMHYGYDAGKDKTVGFRNAFDTIPAQKKGLVGNRDRLTALDVRQINDIYQCKALKTGNWWSSFDVFGWSRVDGFITSLYKGDCNGLHCLEMVRYTEWYDKECYEADWSSSFDTKGWSKCRPGYYVSGLWRNSCDKLSCLESAWCCKKKGYAESYPGPCSNADWWRSFNSKGWSTRTTGAIVGFYRIGCEDLSCLEEALSCPV